MDTVLGYFVFIYIVNNIREIMSLIHTFGNCKDFW